MSEEKRKSNLRKMVQKYGRNVATRHEMIRLGFWDEASDELGAQCRELDLLDDRLGKIDGDLAEGENIEKLLSEIRLRRIERVRQERKERKIKKQREKEAKQAADRERRRRTPPYLGPGVSGGLQFDGGDLAKVGQLGLPWLPDVRIFAEALGIEQSEVSWLSYHSPAATIDHYSRFSIPKRTGGQRDISSPKPRLRHTQKWILINILQKIELHTAAMAFRPHRSILDNAYKHCRRAVVIRMDLKDFFPTVTFPRVKGIFRGFGYNDGISTILALLCTESRRLPMTLKRGDSEPVTRHVALGERTLPQGACTSPMLSNIIARRLDQRLSGLANKHGFTYTRYADDLVFSHEKSDAAVGRLLASASYVVADEGFVVNKEKTKVMRAHQRQTVTGVVVNDEPRVSRRDLRKFRALLHHIECDGADVVSEKLGCDATSHALGYLAFVHMINPEQARKIFLANPWLSIAKGTKQ